MRMPTRSPRGADSVQPLSRAVDDSSRGQGEQGGHSKGQPRNNQTVTRVNGAQKDAETVAQLRRALRVRYITVRRPGWELTSRSWAAHGPYTLGPQIPRGGSRNE
jgi:hypothetical protein